MKIKRYHLRNGLILLHLAFAITGSYLFLLNYRLSEAQLTQQSLNKQTILAKSGSTSIEDLLQNVQNQLSSFIFSFTQVPETASIDKKQTRLEFDSYMQRTQLPVNGVALYDENGVLVILGNRKHNLNGEGQNFSQTSYIQWSKDPAHKGKTYISTPLIGTTGASIGKIIILIEQPIYFGSAYKGTLAIKLLVDDFRIAFIDPLASDPSENSLILNNAGVVLAGNSSLLNKNLFYYAQKQKWSQYKDFMQKLNLAIKGNVSRYTWTFQNPKDKPKVFFASVRKIDIPNTDKDLYMVISSPKDSILASLKPLRIYGFSWLGLGVFVNVLGAVIAVLL